MKSQFNLKMFALFSAVLILLLGYSESTVAEPQARCPCFNAMFAAGACKPLVDQGAGICVLNRGESLICFHGAFDVAWDFESQHDTGLGELCHVSRDRDGRKDRIRERSRDSVQEPTYAEIEACKIEAQVAASLLECS